ncbi:MAG: desulfoferrodoxin family protein [Candidatus Omnitrophica bacterium]|jgi:desulfoferrodoxin-like iron-binding protein|nr:desulfoferrodoxin family protein [Candidatus Omnitrophota bacterium]
MKGHVCKVCKYIAFDSAPEKCPVCGAAKAAFTEDMSAMRSSGETPGQAELEKKHIPVIAVEKKCGLVPEGCLDIHARLGQVQHPMEAAHYIIHIDFYVDKKFVSRVHFMPEIPNPAACLHLKRPGAKVEVVALCNIHGAWFNEART